MNLPSNKTKIVCTIGPASESPEVMGKMIRAGMNIARLNFSHGDFGAHKRVIDNLRAASLKTGRRLTIMADLSGPKMRIGKLVPELVGLKPDDTFTLTIDDIIGDKTRVSVSFEGLPKAVKARRKILLLKRESLVREQIHGGTYDALVDAMSRAIEKLSRDIAGGIRAVSQKEHTGG
jgi:pyruvate kinase